MQLRPLVDREPARARRIRRARTDAPRPDAALPRVAHVVRAYGEISEGFIVDGVREVERFGWESWVVATTVRGGRSAAFPPSERVLAGLRPSVARRLADRACLRSSADRRSSWLGPPLAATRPTVVHAHFGWAAADVRLAARRLGVPLVATFRGSDLTVFPGYSRLYRDYRSLFRQLDCAICISEFLAAKLRGYGFRGHISVVPTGISLDQFPFRGALAPGDVVRLLFVGRLVPVKGLDVLLRAFAIASREDPRLVLDIVGDGPERAASELLAERLSIDRRVTFLGERPRDGVLAALRNAHLFVMPSTTSASGQTEGLGNVQKEAMAVGLPVVATRAGGIPETIPAAQRDEFVPAGDHEALAKRILATLGEADRWPERAAHARAWVEETFAWPPLARRLTDIYDAAWKGQRV